MKRKLKITILTILIFIVSTLFIKVNAASANISASKLNATVGDNITISVSMNAAAWNTKLTGAVNKVFAGNSEDGENMSKTESVTFTPSAAGTYTITLGGDVSDGTTNATTNVGGSVTITVAEKTQPQTNQNTQPATQTPAQPSVTYNNTNQTLYVNKDGINVRSSADTSVGNNILGSLNQGASVQVTGIGSNGWYRVNYNGKTAYIRKDLLTATKPAETNKEEDKDKEEEKKTEEKSTNKALKDLVVENYKLTPDFDPETTKYTVDVTKEVEKLEITPILQDDKSKFEITGNENFKVGNNIVKITVTAEDGTNRIYTITVSKSNKNGDEDATENGLKLSKLQIKDIKLDPEFKPETTNYSVVVSDPSSIKISDITAIAEDEDVEVTIAEAEADKNGNRVITIMLEDKDGSKSGVYQITIKKGIINPITELQNNKNKKIYFLLGGIIAILVIAIIVVIILLKKTSNKDDFQDIKEADELSDDYDYSLKNAIDTANSEETPEYDEMVEDSNVKSQILTNPTDYNVFEDSDNEVGVSDETKRYNMDDDEDFKPKGKKKGKHF